MSAIFQGIFESEGRTYSNWGLSGTTKPAVYVEPISYSDVQAVVADDRRFPTPTGPVGSISSVTSTIAIAEKAADIPIGNDAAEEESRAWQES